MSTKIKNNMDIQIIDFRYDEGIRGRVESDIVPTLTTKSSGISGVPLVVKSAGGGLSKMKIRKLTPLECVRLMGFKDEDYESMRAIGMSDSMIYHCCGDSIVVPVLISIFSQVLPNKDHREEVKKYIEKIFK